MPPVWVESTAVGRATVSMPAADMMGRATVREHLPKQEILNFELKKRSKSAAAGDLLYDSLSPEAFFRLAGQRARKIADLYENTIHP